MMNGENLLEEEEFLDAIGTIGPLVQKFIYKFHLF